MIDKKIIFMGKSLFCFILLISAITSSQINAQEKISFISQYSGIELINPKVKYLEYDWSLNN